MVFRARLGYLWQAWSTDGGATWGKPSSTGLISPLSAVNAKRIPGTDAVVVFWNRTQPGNSQNFGHVPSLWWPRSPLVFAVSHDNCKTWSEPVIVDHGTGMYPSLCFTEKELFAVYKGNPDPKAGWRAAYDLMLVAYDINGILNRKL